QERSAAGPIREDRQGTAAPLAVRAIGYSAEVKCRVLREGSREATLLRPGVEQRVLLLDTGAGPGRRDARRTRLERGQPEPTVASGMAAGEGNTDARGKQLRLFAHPVGEGLNRATPMWPAVAQTEPGDLKLLVGPDGPAAVSGLSATCPALD